MTFFHITSQIIQNKKNTSYMSLQLLNCQKKKIQTFLTFLVENTPKKKKKNATVGMDNFCPKLQFKKYDELLDYFRNNQQGVIQ